MIIRRMTPEFSKLVAIMGMHLLVVLAWKHFSRKPYGKGDNLEAILCDGSMEFRVHFVQFRVQL